MKFLILLVVAIFIHHIECGKYIRTNDTTYFFSYPMARNWFEAQRYCAYNGMYFLSIHTYDENAVILTAIQEVKKYYNLQNTTVHFWAGGTDTGVLVNEFFWVTTGYPTVFKNWIPGYPANRVHPNFNSSMDCLLLHANEYMWYDEHCLAPYSFICQDKLHMPKTHNPGYCH